MRFFEPRHRSLKKGVVEVYPEFRTSNVDDMMTRGREFYAVWNDELGLWSQNEGDVVSIVDRELWAYAEKLKGTTDDRIDVKTMSQYSTKSWKTYRDYIRNLPTTYHQLDEKITFANDPVTKKDYVSKRLPYALQEGACPAWDEMVGTLYSPEEREKIEWAIGAVISGESKKIQKFLVFYGAPGTGKGTVMHIIEELFPGYFVAFNAKALTSANNAFATEVFRDNPLIGIQQDGKLNRIEDNTQLNSIVSHENMTINEKYKASYTARINCFLFLGSNDPVQITNAKSGLIRRLIDVNPRYSKTNPIPGDHYERLSDRIAFEHPQIAAHCLAVYKRLGRHYYDAYRPTEMQYKTDMFFNFVEDGYLVFQRQDGTALKAAYAMYKAYCEESGAEYRLPMHKFREELKNYFREFHDQWRDEDGKQIRSYYRGFLSEKFRGGVDESNGYSDTRRNVRSELSETVSLLDEVYADCPAQYATPEGTPERKWAEVHTTLRDLDTSREHYILPPAQHIVLDFDLKNERGEKDAALNLAAAAKFPPTYMEFSRGGAGVHSHYIYDGDVSRLKREIQPNIEVKVFTGNSALRRRLSKCNRLPIAHISSGLPLKEDKVINWDGVKSEKQLRRMIADCLEKKHHGATKPEIDFIFKLLEDAQAAGMPYDVTDMRPAITAFAQSSSNQAETCLKTCLKMKWKSEDANPSTTFGGPPPLSGEATDILHQAPPERGRGPSSDGEGVLTFYDVEVFPNLFLVNWKRQGEGQPVHRMINPGPKDIEPLLRHKLVGFNCRRYDNHMLYACLMGYTNEELFRLSQRIIDKKSKNAMFGEAYNISYTDILDFCSKKQSLKKWEIELGIHHQELGMPWDQPVPEEKWHLVAEYCDNDVLATEVLFNARQADWTARKILAALSGLTVNDTTNSHTTRIIFGTDRKPQGQFNYRNMGRLSPGRMLGEIPAMDVDLDYTVFDDLSRPIFPGYSFDAGKSLYRGEEVGEGGYVYAEPGVYRNVALLDIASMHPSSIVAENLFGEEYTKRFRDILQARILIKHKDFEAARHILDGKLAPFLEDEDKAKELAGALKIAINSVYGLTSAKFENPFRDPRNLDNLVAKRGALFMVNLKHEVQARGFTVAHIKTDSIKIPNATPEIISFVMDYGKLYGYNFEHEATYERMCLVNDAVYIAKYADEEHQKTDGGWTATGAQFQQPYVFKKLFSHEPITFDDFCETKSVTSGALYLNTAVDRPYGKGGEPEPVYHFVGRAGQFTPIKAGYGGAALVREKDGKYVSVTGTKGYFWLESETVRGTAIEEDIDRSYYDRLADEAVRAIAQYEDFETFVH